MKRLYLLLYCLCGAVFILADEKQELLLPVYYEKILESKIRDIRNADDGFIFFTDTHIYSNNLQSSNIISYVLRNTRLNKVIWGGDAIGGWGTKEQIDEQWATQKEMFQLIKSRGKLYLVRGNHDFTIKASREKNSTRFTYSQSETFKKISESMEYDVVRNEKDPFGLYYYFDDFDHKIRYVIVESFSYSKSKKHIFGNASSISDMQLDWIADVALQTTPPGYGVIFVMHAPITDTTTGKDVGKFEALLKIINAASEKSCVWGEKKKYDFSSMKDVEILMVAAGHHHHDMQTFQHGVLHVITASDAHYMDFKRDPFVFPKQNRKNENEQCIDVFLIDRLSSIIKAIRIGVGGDRTFHLKAVEINVGENKNMASDLNLERKWYSYNASENHFDKSGWLLKNDIVSVSSEGVVFGVRKGSAVVLAQDELGNREIYNVIVK